MKSPKFFRFDLNSIILLGMLLLSFIIRIKGIIEQSYAFTYDVGRDMLAIRDIVVAHHLLFIGPTTGLPGVFYGPWWYYLLTVPFVVGEGNPSAIATFMVLTGTLTAVLGYYLGKKLGSTYLGLLYAGILSFSPVMLGFTTQIWNPNIAPLITMVFYVVVVSVAAVSKKTSSLFELTLFLALGLLAGLSLDAEIVFGTLFIVSILISFPLLFRSLLTLRRVGLFLVGIVVMLSPRVLFEIKNNFIMTRTLLSSFSGALPGGSELPFLERIPQRLGIFFQMWNDTLAVGFSPLGLFEVLVVTVVALFFLSKMEVLLRKIFLLSLMIVGVFYAGLLFFTHDIWSHYLVGLPIVFIVLFGIAVVTLCKSFPATKKFIIICTGLLIILNIAPLRVWDSFAKPLWEGDASVYRNQVAAIEYVYKEANGRPFKYIVYTPPLYDYTYNYLFTWMGEKRFHYVPDQKENKLFFVILEPDLQYPDRLSKWLDSRKNDGRVIKEQTVKGGIIVQTRVNP